MKHFKIVLCLLLVYCSSAAAQYLVVSRSATIKEQPENSAGIIEKVQSGDHLELLADGQQTNGYYSVKAKSYSQNGWIYRTLVRRYEGNIPGAERSSSILSFDPIPSDYYSSAINLEGNNLKTALHEIIKDHVEFSYGEIWDILKETDIDTQNTTHVIGIYSGFSMDATLEYDGGKGWNREHVWAKSYGDFGTTIGAGTDVHHIRVEDVSTNSARNNRTFDECDNQYVDQSGNYNGPTPSFTSESSWTWEPRDEVKGDVARMLFYMAVRYEGEDGEPDLELVDFVVNKSSKIPNHGKLSALLKWHRDDSVDNYERYRNHVIYTKYQHNRNPFIDHPEFVSSIWE